MANIDIGGAVLSGLRVVRREPRAALCWSLIVGAGYATMFALQATMFTTVMSPAFANSAASGPEIAALVGHMLMFEGGVLITVVVVTVGLTIVSAAVWRAILRPDERAWAYLRLGRAELFVLLMRVVVGLVMYVAFLPILFAFTIVGALLAAQLWLAAAVVGGLGVAATIACSVYLELRFALIGPMIVADRELHFIDAWRLTRGRVGRLLAIGLLLSAIAFGVEIVVAAPAFVILTLQGLGPFAAGGMERVAARPAAFVAWALRFDAIGAGLAFVLGGVGVAFFFAPWASAYRDVVTDGAATVT